MVVPGLLVAASPSRRRQPARRWLRRRPASSSTDGAQLRRSPVRLRRKRRDAAYRPMPCGADDDYDDDDDDADADEDTASAAVDSATESDSSLASLSTSNDSRSTKDGSPTPLSPASVEETGFDLDRYMASLATEPESAASGRDSIPSETIADHSCDILNDLASPATPAQTVQDDVSDVCSILDAVEDDEDDTYSVETMPFGNLMHIDTTGLSATLCLSLMDRRDGSVRDMVTSGLRRHLQLQLARQHGAADSGSVSSCSTSQSQSTNDGGSDSCDGSDPFLLSSGSDSSRRPIRSEVSSEPFSQTSSSSEFSDGEGSSSDSKSSGSSRTSTSSRSTESSSASDELPSAIKIPCPYPQPTFGRPTRFISDIQAQAQNCLRRGDLSGAAAAYRRELRWRHCRNPLHRADALSRLVVLSLMMPHSEASAQRALAHCQEAQLLYRQSGRPLQVAVSGMLVGLVQFWSLQPDRALASWKHTMQMVCVVGGADHPYVAVLLNNIGVALHQTEDSDASLRALTESLALQKAALRSGDPLDVEGAMQRLAAVTSNMAVVLDEGKRQLGRAATFLEKAAALYASIDVDDHIEEAIAPYLEDLTIRRYSQA